MKGELQFVPYAIGGTRMFRAVGFRAECAVPKRKSSARVYRVVDMHDKLLIHTTMKPHFPRINRRGARTLKISAGGSVQEPDPNFQPYTKHQVLASHILATDAIKAAIGAHRTIGAKRLPSRQCRFLAWRW